MSTLFSVEACRFADCCSEGPVLDLSIDTIKSASLLIGLPMFVLEVEATIAFSLHLACSLSLEGSFAKYTWSCAQRADCMCFHA